MEEQSLNTYEGLYVLSPMLGDEAKALLLDKIEKLITAKGGQVVQKIDMGRRRLAYEIEGQREGFYMLWYFKAQPDLIKSFWKEYQLMEGLLRFITLRTDEVKEKLEFKSLVSEKEAV